MKDYSRLRVGMQLSNNPAGLLQVSVVEFDGGEFGLNSKITDDGSLVLVDPSRPAGYGVLVGGDSEALRQLGNALVRMSKRDDTADAAVSEG